ncbi:hypothetical protein M513_10005, partial [Trichuris suis]
MGPVRTTCIQTVGSKKQQRTLTLKQAYRTISFWNARYRGLQRGKPSVSPLIGLVHLCKRRRSPRRRFISTVSAMSSAL